MTAPLRPQTGPTFGSLRMTPAHDSGPGASEPRPTIRGFVLGPFDTNCYVVHVPGSQDCWVVDAGFDPAELIEYVKEEGLRPRAVVLTHAHLDHIGGVGEVLQAFPGTPILIHEAEGEWLGDPELNLSAMGGMAVTAPPADRLLREGDGLELAGTNWTVLHVPGHSPGGIALVHEPSGQALVGDSLFAGSVGRTDFPGSSSDLLLRSIRTKLYSLPDETVIYPGHGPQSSIKVERRSNPFVRG